MPPSGGMTRFRNNKKERKLQPNASPEADERPMRKKIEGDRKPLKYSKARLPAVVKKRKEKL